MPDIDPDQLLKELDARLAVMRLNRRKPSERNQAMRLGLVVMFFVLLILVLWVMQFFFSQVMPRRGAPVQPPTSQAPSPPSR